MQIERRSVRRAGLEWWATAKERTIKASEHLRGRNLRSKTLNRTMPAPHQRDYFAELYVAGLMGDVGWAVYFPKRDVGFDFVAIRDVEGETLVRPVQVKGLYPTEVKKDKAGYGYIGSLSQLHNDMILVLPYFSTDRAGPAPECIAYMPRAQIRTQAGRGFKCTPAKFVGGRAQPRESFQQYFGLPGLAATAHPSWGQNSVTLI